MKKIIALLVVATTLTAAHAQKTEGQNPFLKLAKEFDLQTAYTVDMTMQVSGIAVMNKIYQNGEQSRFDTTIPFLNSKMSTIQTTKDGESSAIILVHHTKKYVVQKATGEPSETDAEITITDMGTETYNGEKCTKKRIVIQNDASSTMDILFSPKNKKMPVKITATANDAAQDGKDAAVVEMIFTNYDFTKPAATLFAIPADYAEAATMEEAMGADGGLMGMLGAMAAASDAAEDDATAQDQSKTEIDTAKAAQDAKDTIKKEAAIATEGAVKGAVRGAIRGFF